MTWHHVALIMTACIFVAIVVAVCGTRTDCQNIISQSIALATVIISGTLGHAGNLRGVAKDRQGSQIPASLRESGERPAAAIETMKG